MQQVKDYSDSVYGGLANLLYIYCQNNDVNIPPKLLEIQNLERVDFSIWSDLLKEIQKQSSVSGLGLKISEFVQPKHLGVIGYMALSCETLGEAFSRYYDFHRLIYDGTPLKFKIFNDNLFIRWEESPTPYTHQVTDEISIALLFQFIRLYVATEKIKVHEIHFRYAEPANIKIYENFFDCKIMFSQTAMQVILPLSVLNTPIKQADSTLQKLLTKQAQDLLEQLPNSSHMGERLQQSILKGLQINSYQIEDVASELNISVRQLQRYLQQQNTTYQQTLQNVRKLLAVQYLQDPYLSLQEISLLLSYSEQSAFQRAFKQWMGVTPQQWRLMEQKP